MKGEGSDLKKELALNPFYTLDTDEQQYYPTVLEFLIHTPQKGNCDKFHFIAIQFFLFPFISLLRGIYIHTIHGRNQNLGFSFFLFLIIQNSSFLGWRAVQKSLF